MFPEAQLPLRNIFLQGLDRGSIQHDTSEGRDWARSGSSWARPRISRICVADFGTVFCASSSGYLKAVWPGFWGAFLRSGRPRGPGKALQNVGATGPKPRKTKIYDLSPGGPQIVVGGIVFRPTPEVGDHPGVLPVSLPICFSVRALIQKGRSRCHYPFVFR